MRRRSTIILLAWLPFMVSAATKQYQIIIDNPLSVARVNAPIVIQLGELEPGFNVLKSVVTEEKIEIPCQIDDLNHDDVADEVAFMVDIPASGSRILQLTLSDEGSRPSLPSLEDSGYKLPIAFNNSIALKGWDGKKTVEIDSVDVLTERLVAAGPVRTISELKIDGWNYQGSNISMLNRYTHYSGHQDMQIDVEFDEPLSGETFSTGVPRTNGKYTPFWSDHTGLMSIPGYAIFVPHVYIYGETATPDEYIYKVKAPGGRNFRYYAMSAPGKEDDKEEWFGMLQVWRKNLDNPLRIVIEEK